MTSEQGFIHGVCCDPSLLPLLSLSTIVPIFVNTNVLTHTFDKSYNTSVIMNNFGRNNDITPYTKCEQEKESGTSQCHAALRNFFFFLVFFNIYVIMGVAGGRLMSAAILMAIYLVSCLIAAIALILAVFDEFNQDQAECETTMNYYVCVVLFCFNKTFYFVCMDDTNTKCEQNNPYTKILDNKQILKQLQLQYILIVIDLIVQALNDRLSIVQVLTNITMIAREIELFDQLFLSLLSVILQ